MKDRAITLIGAVLALILATGVMFPGLRRPLQDDASRITSQDAGPAGLMGAYRWLAQQGVPLRRLRERYTALDAGGTHAASTGNILVIAQPMRDAPHAQEREALAAWLARGNSMVVLGLSIAERSRPGRASSDLLSSLGIETWSVKAVRKPDCENHPTGDDCAVVGDRVELHPDPADREYPILAGVSSLAALLTPLDLLLRDERLHYRTATNRLFQTWLVRGRDEPALWEFRYGSGRLWVSRYAQLFSNDSLGHADNARLLANMLALALGPGGQVIFDDMHQGDTTLYDASALFADPRWHATVAFLMAIWLVYILGFSAPFSQRGTVRGVTPAAFTRAVGGFYARHLRATDVAEALLQRFHVEARARLRSTASPSDWTALRRAPGVNPQTVDLLEKEQDALSLAVATGRRRYDLRRLTLLIQELRHALR
jgi:hypothetical protein